MGWRRARTDLAWRPGSQESAVDTRDPTLTLALTPLSSSSVRAPALLTEPLNPAYKVGLSILKRCVLKALLTFFCRLVCDSLRERLFSLEVLLLLNKSHSGLLLATQAPAIRFLHSELACNQASRSPP